MRRKISAHVDGGLSGGSRVRRAGSEDPHWREQNFFEFVYQHRLISTIFSKNIVEKSFNAKDIQFTEIYGFDNH